MPEPYIKIVSFGLIGESKDGDKFRHIIFEELTTGRKADYLILKKKRPVLWSDIEKLEKGKILPPYKGYITDYNGMELVVIGDESLENAYESQKWKLNIKKRISYFEAEKMRNESKGYCTNLTHKGAMEIFWKPVAKEVKMIKFRYYSGKGNFSWSQWFEISG